MTKVILAFPCMGKTYLGNKNKKCLDLESSDFFFIKDERYENSEQWKGLSDRKPNPNGLSEYLKAIKNAYDSQKYDYIFTSQSPDVVRGIVDLGLKPIFVKPHPGKLSEDIFRYRAISRGNNEDWINKTIQFLSKNLSEFYSDEELLNFTLTTVSPELYLSEILYNIL